MCNNISVSIEFEIAEGELIKDGSIVSSDDISEAVLSELQYLDNGEYQIVIRIEE